MNAARGVWGVAAGACLCLCPAGAAAQQRDGDSARFSIRPDAYVQFDLRTYPDWNVARGTGRLNRQEVEIRRVRAGVDGRWGPWSFEFSVDPLDEDDSFIKDAYAQIRLGRGQRLRAGQFKLPGSREYDTPARRIDFLERSTLAGQLAAGRDIGVMFDGGAGALDYQIGVFAGDGQGRQERAEVTAAGRLAWEPVQGLELGGYVSAGDTTAVESDAPNGLNGRTPSGYRFFERLYVDGRRVRAGGDVEWTRGPWRVVLEGLRVTDERRGEGVELQDLPSFVATSWTLTGSRRFGRPRDPQADPATLSRPERWPWQIALRFEHVEYDDAGSPTGRDSVRPRATDVRARGVDSLLGSLSYQATRWLRLVGETGLERYTDARTAPNAGRQGNYFTAGLRFQFELP